MKSQKYKNFSELETSASVPAFERQGVQIHGYVRQRLDGHHCIFAFLGLHLKCKISNSYSFSGTKYFLFQNLDYLHIFDWTYPRRIILGWKPKHRNSISVGFQVLLATLT